MSARERLYLRLSIHSDCWRCFTPNVVLSHMTHVTLFSTQPPPSCSLVHQLSQLNTEFSANQVRAQLRGENARARASGSFSSSDGKLAARNDPCPSPGLAQGAEGHANGRGYVYVQVGSSEWGWKVDAHSTINASGMAVVGM